MDYTIQKNIINHEKRSVYVVFYDFDGFPKIFKIFLDKKNAQNCVDENKASDFVMREYQTY